MSAASLTTVVNTGQAQHMIDNIGDSYMQLYILNPAICLAKILTIKCIIWQVDVFVCTAF